MYRRVDEPLTQAHAGAQLPLVGHDPPPQMAQGNMSQQYGATAREAPAAGMQGESERAPLTRPLPVPLSHEDGALPHHDAQRWAAHVQAGMEGVLSCEQAYELLVADSFQPGHRDPLLRKTRHGLQQALFKECPKRRLKGEPGADRWRNSGGEKGSSFLRNKEGVQVIRRRYGTVSQADGTKLKYHEYNLVNQDQSTGKLADSKGVTLFHLLPDVRGERESNLSPTGSTGGIKRSYSDTSSAGTDETQRGAGNGPSKAQRNTERAPESSSSALVPHRGAETGSWSAGEAAGQFGQSGQSGRGRQRDDSAIRQRGADSDDWEHSQSQVAQVCCSDHRQPDS